MTRQVPERINPLDNLPIDLLQTLEGVTVRAGLSVPLNEYEILWNMVQSGFIDLNRKSYEKQDMTREELEEDLESPRVLKYVARDPGDSPIGLLTVHVGLDDIVWTDTQPLNEVQKKVDPNAIPYYVGTIVVPPDLRGTDTAASIIRGSFMHFKRANEMTQNRSLVFFDCAHANYPWLGNFIQSIGNPSEEFPDLRSKVTELYSEAWVQGPDGVIKVQDSPVLENNIILDKQHYYSIDVDPVS